MNNNNIFLLSILLASTMLYGERPASGRRTPKALATYRDISGKDFSEQVLTNAQFQNAQASGTDFSQADLSGANFRDANLSRANFREANLTSVDFAGADLTGANFVRAKGLKYANLLQAKHLEGINLLGATLDGPVLREKLKARGAVFSYEEWENINKRLDDIERALAGDKNLEGADLRGANLEKINLTDVRLTNAQLQGANLREARLWFTKIDGANFSNTDLSGSLIKPFSAKKTLFYKSIMHNVTIEPFDAKDAIFYKVEGLSKEQQNFLKARGAQFPYFMREPK